RLTKKEGAALRLTRETLAAVEPDFYELQDFLRTRYPGQFSTYEDKNRSGILIAGPTGKNLDAFKKEVESAIYRHYLDSRFELHEKIRAYLTEKTPLRQQPVSQSSSHAPGGRNTGYGLQRFTRF